jgi:hypothetical protein
MCAAVVAISVLASRVLGPSDGLWRVSGACEWGSRALSLFSRMQDTAFLNCCNVQVLPKERERESAPTSVQVRSGAVSLSDPADPRPRASLQELQLSSTLCAVCSVSAAHGAAHDTRPHFHTLHIPQSQVLAVAPPPQPRSRVPNERNESGMHSANPRCHHSHHSRASR